MIVRIRPLRRFLDARSSRITFNAGAHTSASAVARGRDRPGKNEPVGEKPVALDRSSPEARGRSTVRDQFTAALVRHSPENARTRQTERVVDNNAEPRPSRKPSVQSQGVELDLGEDLRFSGSIDLNSRVTRDLIKRLHDSRGDSSESECQWYEFPETSDSIGISRHGVWYKSEPITEQKRNLPELITYHRLRDACPCSKCIDPSTRQRTHTGGEAYREIESSPFVKGEIGEDLIKVEQSGGGSGLRINWASDHSAFYPLSLLTRLATGAIDRHATLKHAQRFLWKKDSLLAESSNLYVQYDKLAQHDRSRTLLDLLIQLQRFGIVIIKGVPTERTGDEDCTLREVMGWIGELRNTFYGETWDVKNVANSKNVAYTNLNLGLHMDLLYFSSPPRFQALHCLRNRVEGGSSYFVDGMAAARTFHRRGGKRIHIEYGYDNDSHYLRHVHSLVEGSPDKLKSSINWSPPFQTAPTPAQTGANRDQQDSYYRQLADFQRILDQPERQWEFTMEEGDLVLFDNRRVLHARRAFRDLTEEEAKMRGVEVVEGEPSRWLKGCYLDGEVVWDKLVTLGRKLEG